MLPESAARSGQRGGWLPGEPVKDGHMEQGEPRKGRVKREQILIYICDYANERSGPTPSIREVAKHFSVSYSTAYHHVMRLGLEGKLQLRDGKLIVVGAEWYEPAEVAQIR